MIRTFIALLLKRTYTYLFLTAFSIGIGGFFFGAVISTTQTLAQFIQSEGKVLIGGDLSLTSNVPIATTSPVFEELKKEGYVFQEEFSVQTVFKNAVSSQTAVASVRAVSDSFPLYGEVLVQGNGTNIYSLTPGGIYAEKVFLEKIGGAVGDMVTLGSTTFKILGILEKEPDSISLGVSFAPRVLVRNQDFRETGIDISQSRTSYKTLLKASDGAVITPSLLERLRASGGATRLRVDDATDGPNSYIRGLSAVTEFIGIVLAVVLFLVVVNIIANLTFIFTRFRKMIALLKTFGATTKQIQKIYLTILGVLGLGAGLIGSYLGSVGATYLLPYIENFVEISITPGNNLGTVFLGGLVGLIIVVIGSLPFLYSVKKVTPKQLLQSGNHTFSRSSFLTKILVYIPIPLVLVGILYVLTQDFEISLYSVLTVIVLFFFAVGIVAACVYIGFKARYALGLIGRSGISSIRWRGIEAIIGIASIITACTGIFVVSAVEDNTIANLQQNISQNAPGVYIIDITPSQLEEVRSIAGPTFIEYPIVRGRLQQIGPIDIRDSNRGDLTREFNTTFQTEKNSIEEITGGVWHGTTTQKAVSVDREFATEVGDVRLGDTVQVLIQGILVEATITSFHTANRSNGTPFFYLIFSPDVLQDFPASYFGTVEGTDQEINSVEQKLGQRFPNIIPIRTQNILNSVAEIISTLVYVLKLIGIPSILLGMILILVMTGQSMYERRSDALILRAFGLTRRQIVYLFMFEILLVIFLATGIAYAAAHMIAYILNTFVFSFDIFVFSVMPLYISAVLIVVVSVYGYLLSKYITDRPLKGLLAEK